MRDARMRRNRSQNRGRTIDFPFFSCAHVHATIPSHELQYIRAHEAIAWIETRPRIRGDSVHPLMKTKKKSSKNSALDAFSIVATVRRPEISVGVTPRCAQAVKPLEGDDADVGAQSPIHHIMFKFAPDILLIPPNVGKVTRQHIERLRANVGDCGARGGEKALMFVRAAREILIKRQRIVDVIGPSH